MARRRPAFTRPVPIDWTAPAGRLGPGKTQPTNPILAWVLSQYGLVDECPQRHRRVLASFMTVRPVPLRTSRLPETARGPLRCGLISNSPSLTSSGSKAAALGSPVATKPAVLCEPSQKGLFFEAPQRQSVAR